VAEPKAGRGAADQGLASRTDTAAPFRCLRRPHERPNVTMKLDRAGSPFIAGALIPAIALAALRRPRLAAVFAAFGGFAAFFFRDPERTAPEGENVVVAPADGRVVMAGDADPDVAPPGTWRQVSIFLSVFDVHVNRVPVSGRVTRVEYRPGTYVAAYKAQASTQNERSEVWIQHGAHAVVCRQVAGLIARRVVCRLTPGTDVRAGDKLGIIKFGSRCDVFLPPDAVLLVKPDQQVRAGETLLATI
jgi:phosphatidylserine decarboxylase